jgi:predicted Fe-S protein YdhL (DUF1289 family)
MSFLGQSTPLLSPCIGVCKLDDCGLCEGCHRTADEITRWMSMSDVERARLMHEVLPQRVQQQDMRK